MEEQTVGSVSLSGQLQFCRTPNSPCFRMGLCSRRERLSWNVMSHLKQWQMPNSNVPSSDNRRKQKLETSFPLPPPTLVASLGRSQLNVGSSVVLVPRRGKVAASSFHVLFFTLIPVFAEPLRYSPWSIFMRACAWWNSSEVFCVFQVAVENWITFFR
ncbi:hypothetical protein J6590_046202 [Homalodisca vitripennis]|nr:hypothetical protein J6590_046202 [Homalodisca vitripennis]